MKSYIVILVHVGQG